MSTPQSSVEWFQNGGKCAESDLQAPIAAGVMGAATNFLSSLPVQRQGICLRAALAIACHGATLFEPHYAHPAELRWCGREGQPAPTISFRKDFIDRRSVVTWSLYRLTVAKPVDEPIFSAQVRVTMVDPSLAAFNNFDKPAAIVVSSEAGAVILEDGRVPPPVRQELRRATQPLVYVVMQELAGFDDVILYTALFNFSRAFCAFQTGPWQAMNRALTDSRPFCDSMALSLAELRAVQRAALAVTELAWEASYQQPIEAMQPTLIGILNRALSSLKA